MSSGQLEAYLPLVLVLVVGYLLIIRPTRRRARAAATLQSALSPGDEVMLSSGFFATVVGIQDEIATVELAAGTVVRVHRGAVTQIVVDKPTDDLRTDDDSSGNGAFDVRETPHDDNPGVS